MTVEDLLELLAEMPRDAEVRPATQPNWPMQAAVHGVTSGAALAGETDCPEHRHYACDECQNPNVVWITEGSQISDSPYAPSGVWNAAVR